MLLKFGRIVIEVAGPAITDDNIGEFIPPMSPLLRRPDETVAQWEQRIGPVTAIRLKLQAELAANPIPE